MKKILTVTLNPAFDLHLSLDAFLPERENYAHSARSDAGGKGVNISRVLASMGVSNEAYIALGKENAASFEAGLRADGVRYRPFYTEGRIRENITLHPAAGRETRVSLDTFALSGAAYEEIEAALLAAAEEDVLLAFAGRIPRGVDKERVISLLCRLRELGAALYLDSNSLTGEDLLRIRPAFIKPNEEEIASLYGTSPADAESAALAASRMVQDGFSRCVMISLGARGAAFADESCRAAVTVPTVTAVSTIGAGDSTVAGMMMADSKRLATSDALAFACAFGTAACLTEGTRPPERETVERIRAQIKVNVLE